jgi:hypothetical protein
MAPPFEPARFRLGTRSELSGRYPAHRARIGELTRG